MSPLQRTDMFQCQLLGRFCGNTWSSSNEKKRWYIPSKERQHTI